MARSKSTPRLVRGVPPAYPAVEELEPEEAQMRLKAEIAGFLKQVTGDISGARKAEGSTHENRSGRA